MGNERIFVGRKAELERFGEVLADLKGQAANGRRFVGRVVMSEGE